MLTLYHIMCCFTFSFFPYFTFNQKKIKLVSRITFPYPFVFTLTHNIPSLPVHWDNTVKISNYIRDLQQPGGVGERVWTSFSKTIQPEQTQLDVVVEILQCIIKI